MWWRELMDGLTWRFMPRTHRRVQNARRFYRRTDPPPVPPPQGYWDPYLTWLEEDVTWPR